MLEISTRFTDGIIVELDGDKEGRTYDTDDSDGLVASHSW